MRALEMAPRVSGGVAHAMAACVGVRELSAPSAPKSAVTCAADVALDPGPLCPDDLVLFVREILATKLHSFRAR